MKSVFDDNKISRPEPPKLENYGLTEDRLKYFFQRYEKTKYLRIIIGLISFLFYLFLLSDLESLKWSNKLTSKFFLAIFLAFLPGFLVGHFINKFCVWFDKWKKESQADYPNYLKYNEAYNNYLDILDRIKKKEVRREKAKEAMLRKQVQWWKTLNGIQFERELLTLLKKKGYDIIHTGKSGDAGVDFILKIDEKKIIVQCKAHKSFINQGTVRDLYGTLIHQKADEAWLITTSGYYKGAQSFAVGKPIKLMTIHQVLEMPKE